VPPLKKCESFDAPVAVHNRTNPEDLGSLPFGEACWPAGRGSGSTHEKPRAALAAELLGSLDGPADPDAESAWDVEIERRIAAIETGTIRLEPWEQVRQRIEKDILGR
jgi:putative addiction module component (TIGR02574 family)